MGHCIVVDIISLVRYGFVYRLQPLTRRPKYDKKWTHVQYVCGIIRVRATTMDELINYINHQLKVERSFWFSFVSEFMKPIENVFGIDYLCATDG